MKEVQRSQRCLDKVKVDNRSQTKSQLNRASRPLEFVKSAYSLNALRKVTGKTQSRAEIPVRAH